MLENQFAYAKFSITIPKSTKVYSVMSVTASYSLTNGKQKTLSDKAAVTAKTWVILYKFFKDVLFGTLIFDILILGDNCRRQLQKYHYRRTRTTGHWSPRLRTRWKPSWRSARKRFWLTSLSCVTKGLYIERPVQQIQYIHHIQCWSWSLVFKRQEHLESPRELSSQMTTS